MDAFISYNSRDAEIVHDIATKLEQAGVSCWLDVLPLLIAMKPMVMDRSIALEDGARDIRRHRRVVVGERVQEAILSDLIRYI